MSTATTAYPIPSLPEIARAGGAVPYLPLEWLRDEALGAALFGGQSGAKPTVVARSFRSSGTTGGAAYAAISRFSATGIDAYRRRSCAHFRRVLSAVLPHSAAHAQGISLIPTAAAWPDSSLAQMVAWIADELPVAYGDPQGSASGTALTAALQQLVHAAQGPLWLFGTAFHWIAVIDALVASGQTLSLPHGSVVFETGGTKGRSRSVSRDELFREMSLALGISEEAIISEYGMCELACQAYDFVPFASRGLGWPRRFRFDPLVSLSVLTSPGQGESHGQGALLVTDPERPDYPLPLRTEDLVRLHADQSFELLGRAPQSPLKGCSLRVEGLLGADLESTAASKGAPTAAVGTAAEAADRRPVGGTLATRAEHLHRFLQEFLRADATLSMLATELGSIPAAEHGLTCTRRGLPTAAAGWLRAAEAATASTSPWWLLLPENHSLVGLHPLAIAYAAGLTVHVRLPRAFAGTGSLIGNFCRGLATLPESKVTLLGPEWRLTPDFAADHPEGRVLVYGSDDTITALEQALPKARVQGFGSRFGLSLVDANVLAQPETQAAVIADALGLAQRGCVASRLLIIVGRRPGSFPSLAEGLARAAAAFWPPTLDWRLQAALALEADRWLKMGWAPPVNTSPHRQPLLALRTIGNSWRREDVPQWLTSRPYALPCLWLTPEQMRQMGGQLAAAFAETGQFGTLTTSYRGASEPAHSFIEVAYRRGARIAPLGTANELAFDGCHEGRPLFAGC